MKANRGSRPLLLVAAAFLALVVGSCSEKQVAPPPMPRPTQRPAPPPSPPPPAALDWRQAPITPGDWTWALENGQSVARFADGVLVLRCDRASGTIVLQRAGLGSGPVPITIATTSVLRTLSAAAQPGPPATLAVSLMARDPLIDAMVFSRGRFALEAPGMPPLYVPSWPEVGRVAEDCR
jgi:hypothetical protein